MEGEKKPVIKISRDTLIPIGFVTSIIGMIVVVILFVGSVKTDIALIKQEIKNIKENHLSHVEDDIDNINSKMEKMQKRDEDQEETINRIDKSLNTITVLMTKKNENN